MSDEPDHTHRVVRKAHHRSTDGTGPPERFEPGDRITPTEDELDAIPSRFEAIEAAESAPSADTGDSDEAEAEATVSGEDAEDAAESDESGGETPEDYPEGELPDADDLTEAFVESADYDDLRSLASEFEDVNGNWGEDRLRAELAERAEG